MLMWENRKYILNGEDYICKGDIKKLFSIVSKWLFPNQSGIIQIVKNEQNLHLIKRSVPYKYTWICKFQRRWDNAIQKNDWTTKTIKIDTTS